MATLSFGVKGPTQDFTTSLTIADSDGPRIMAWLLSPNSGYGTVTENVQSTVPDASWSPSEEQTEADRPSIPVQQWVTRPATPEEAAKAYAESTLRSLLSSTVAWERAQAAEVAANSVQPIPVEPRA
jgi:hypothetical protein